MFSVSDACVKVEADGTPKVFWANAWRPICGHWFWDNNNGAKSVCQRIGYSNGELSRTNGAYSEDAISLGRCNSNDDILSCSRGCRDYIYILNIIISLTKSTLLYIFVFISV